MKREEFLEMVKHRGYELTDRIRSSSGFPIYEMFGNKILLEVRKYNYARIIDFGTSCGYVEILPFKQHRLV